MSGTTISLEEKQHLYALAESGSDIFYERSGRILSEPWAKEIFSTAVRANPAKAFEKSHRFASQPWAKDLLIEAAKNAPASAFEHFYYYAFPNGKPTDELSYDQSQLERHLGIQARREIRGAMWSIDQTPDEKFVTDSRQEIKVKRWEEITARSAAARANEISLNHTKDVLGNAMRKWAGDVLIEAEKHLPNWRDELRSDQPKYIQQRLKLMQDAMAMSRFIRSDDGTNVVKAARF